MKPIGAALALLSLAACQGNVERPSPLVAGNASAPVAGEPHGGALAFAQAACGGCHAAGAGSLSPNPKSPAFADIANRDGVTQETLATWLRDAHNYPEDMDFDLYAAQVDALSAYILTLRDPDYRSPIS